MRVFIAIEMMEDIKDYLGRIQNALKENSREGNFTLKENIHLTLRFIGEVKDHELDGLKRAMDKATVNQRGFHIHLRGLGRFTRRNSGIIWAGIEESQMLEKLHSNLELALEEEGYSKERRSFTPHITLGRKVVFTKGFEEVKERIHMDRKAMLVDRITLMESRRIKGALKYIPIYTKEFDNSN